MKKTITVFLVTAVVACCSLTQAQPPAAPRFGFSNAPATAELQKIAQTPGTKGDQQRHYYFADAKAEMPYHLYVPANYNPKVATPLVVALHGYGGDHNYFFAIVQDLQALCDKYGYIFVAPMGYSVSGWYGAPMSVPGARPAASDNQPQRLPAAPQNGSPAEQLRERQLSEQDVLNVIALVRKEYNIAADKTYLMGHSMGGFGVWYLGAKYAQQWAAIAPMSGTTPTHEIDVPALSKLPVLVAVGGLENPTVEASKGKVAMLKAAGGVTAYVEIENGTHGSMIPPATQRIFEFFSTHRKGH